MVDTTVAAPGLRQIGDSRFGQLAKKAAPGLSFVVPNKLGRVVSIYLDILQGKGSGTGWDMSGEAVADSSVLRGIVNPVILDGGANYGQWARALDAVLIGREATYFLFEPQRACQEALSQLNMQNVTVVEAALGEKPGEVVLSADVPGSAVASVYERHESYFGDVSAHHERVAMVTLDDTIIDHKIDRVDLLKLDIEGAELTALKGASKSLSSGVIRAVAFEFGSANIYSRTFFRDFWDLLTPFGFRFARVLPGGRLLHIKHYSEEHEHFRGVSNYLTRR